MSLHNLRFVGCMLIYSPNASYHIRCSLFGSTLVDKRLLLHCLPQLSRQSRALHVTCVAIQASLSHNTRPEASAHLKRAIGEIDLSHLPTNFTVPVQQLAVVGMERLFVAQ